MKNKKYIIILTFCLMVIFLFSGCKICNEKFDACDYSVHPPKCASTLEEAKNFCKSLGTDCKAIKEEGKWKCLCPSECGQL